MKLIALVSTLLAATPAFAKTEWPVEPSIRIIKAGGIEQPAELAEGYCNFPRFSTINARGFGGNVDARNSRGVRLLAGFMIREDLLKIPLSEGAISERVAGPFNRVLDTEGWRYERGQLIGESVYFDASSNAGTFRRIIITVDKKFERVDEVKYEIGELTDRSENVSQAEAKDILSCTTSLY